MGKRQQTLTTLLNGTSGKLPFPTHHSVSQFNEEIDQVYRSIGGIMTEFPLNLRKWDMEINGIAVELDEDLHFNRYRTQTLQSPIYDKLPAFPHREYSQFCEDHEFKCLSAGSYGGKWTNRSCERQFGIAGEKGDLSGCGAPRWKQRAFYDFVKDLTPIVLGVPLARISVWDNINADGRIISVDAALQASDPIISQSLMRLINQRANINGG